VRVDHPPAPVELKLATVTPPAGPRRPRRSRRQRRRLGLRARVTITFGLGALALSSVISVIIFATARTNLIDQEIASLRSQAFANAYAVENAVKTTPPSGSSSFIPDLLGTLGPDGSYSVLYYHGQWLEPYLPGYQLQPPVELESLVVSGKPGDEVYQRGDTTHFALATPIDGGQAAYLEDFDLTSVVRTLRILLATLIAVAVATTIAGAVVGRWAAGRALRPLHDVADAASAIAGGQLDTRLETADAADLEVLASSFNRMVDRLQERIERDARFTSDVSHELRSPLTTLTASLSVLESRSADMPERAQRAVALAGAELRRFQRMVSDLLEISRLDAGATDIVLEDVTVGELVRRTFAAVTAGSAGPATMAEAAGAAITAGSAGTTDPAGVPAQAPSFPVVVAAEVENRHLLVDKRRFERVIANLVENASRYAGGVTLVTVDRRGPTVRIAIDDAGPGIPLEERERIFERFSRGSSGRRRGAGDGTGLGLALVAEHVRLQGGGVSVESADGAGARFVVELPLQDGTAS
jgi:two-component system, OmpR family, sensor histidine kinase MtrB